jgi:retinol dehydrogenase-12
MTHRCDPKVFEKDLTDQIIIVTGANSGIGLATAHQLAYQKATVILACRNEAKAKVAIDEIDDPEHTVFMHLDLSDLSSVRKFVQTFTSKYDRLDVLVNNAGVMACPFGRTKDGFETHIGCNHLGHFLLFKLLTPVLLRTAEDTCKPSRFIALSSCYSSAANSPGAKSYPKIDFDDFNWESKPYHKIHAYQQSKLANYLTALEASKKYDSSKLICASLHPG